MEAITKAEFELTHSAKDVEEKEFDLLARIALDLTELLCFGRAEQKEESARRAMKEMISYWIERGGIDAVSGPTNPKSERIGNYSVTNREENVITLHGVSVSPAALVILDGAGLRNCNL
ncbi:MAG: hypothetical protein J6B86_05270 [Clostridia bacterium]|nr:hypothetical protein [Clostridia bacterium]